MYHPRINWTPDMDAALNVEAELIMLSLLETPSSATAIRLRTKD